MIRWWWHRLGYPGQALRHWIFVQFILRDWPYPCWLIPDLADCMRDRRAWEEHKADVREAMTHGHDDFPHDE